jgi:hypothetical protein
MRVNCERRKDNLFLNTGDDRPTMQPITDTAEAGEPIGDPLIQDRDRRLSQPALVGEHDRDTQVIGNLTWYCARERADMAK